MSSAMPSILMPWTKRRDPMLFFPQEYKRMIWECIMPCVKTSLYIERSDVESLQWAGTLAKLSSRWYFFVLDIMLDAKNKMTIFPPLLGGKEVGGEYTAPVQGSEDQMMVTVKIMDYDDVEQNYMINFEAYHSLHDGKLLTEFNQLTTNFFWNTKSADELAREVQDGVVKFNRRGSLGKEPLYFNPNLSSFVIFDENTWEWVVAHEVGQSGTMGTGRSDEVMNKASLAILPAQIMKYLGERNLYEFAAGFAAIGVEHMEDLDEVLDTDLGNMGFSEMQLRRFRKKNYALHLPGRKRVCHGLDVGLPSVGAPTGS